MCTPTFAIRCINSNTCSELLWILTNLLLFLAQTYLVRQIVLTVFVGLWSVRLASYLLYRILKTGTDSRFDDRRNKCGRFAIFWTFQVSYIYFPQVKKCILLKPSTTSSGPVHAVLKVPFDLLLWLAEWMFIGSLGSDSLTQWANKHLKIMWLVLYFYTVTSKLIIHVSYIIIWFKWL